MRILVYGGLILAVLAVIAGVVRAARKKKFALVYCSVAFLLAMLLAWWALPVCRFLQHTPDDQVEHLFLSELFTEKNQTISAVDEQKAEVLAALRETSFYHEHHHAYSLEHNPTHYYVDIHMKSGARSAVYVFTYPDGSAEVYLDTRAPWQYRAADPAPLARAVERAMGK